MTTHRRVVIALSAGLAGLLSIAAFGAGTASAKTCSLSIKGQRSFGPDYVIGLKAKNVSCRKAKKVVRAYHECRYTKPRPGKKGRCTHRVKRFKCSEEPRTDLPGAQYHTKVRCKRGNAKIVHVYQQSY